MRFYAVRTEAIELTHQALQKLDQGRKGSGRASRALRVATLYGHLQCRARDGHTIQLSCRDLATAWHVQTRELRADLQDLEAIGWLSYTSGPLGLSIRLNEPVARLEPSHEGADLEAVDDEAVNDSPAVQMPSTPEEPAGAIAQPRVMAEVMSEPSAEPKRAPVQSPLIAQFAVTYNQHKPQTWPAYKPTGNALAGPLQKAIRHAGGADAFWSVLIQALRSMPQFWRVTYPQGRSGADCAMALLSADRKAAGLGAEFWHVFCWGNQGQMAVSTAPYSGRLCGGIGGNTPQVGSSHLAAIHHPDFVRAQKLLVWGDHAWRCQGMEAFDLPASEKQRLAELLEAAGLGEPGRAAEQFAQEARR
jgi:hypothetical protein